MPPRRRRTSLTIAKDADEAMNLMFMGFKWFLSRYPKITVTVVAWAFMGVFGLIVATVLYFSTDRVTTSPAKPLGEEVRMEDVPKAMVVSHQKESERVPIIVNGQTWGYADASFVTYVSDDRTRIFVYRRGWPAPIWLEGVKLKPPQTK